ncbi:hypothetical protein N7489_004972 [Penicillium chrysogenum]|uniref:Uncharacterized protein n=1 Tax=Penicillium chrysogenum TaxID=5076 RepID=A0ABQ8WDG4_PENCH|nr:uncharacterized protein N7489_004972 [Penicillium chrysogenum]KAJ5244876.1 hypothetical protein N7489_004972 [Penicillium chrysogenum]KAJ5264681.1 hypothetical protein N7505_007474 [Penicillium chrysogenum]KAJ5849269.1 hypothetical protein N7534_007958 [Penicillium rubens]
MTDPSKTEVRTGTNDPNMERYGPYESHSENGKTRQTPAFPGPGSDASAPEKANPRESRALNKLGPTVDSAHD